MKSNYRNLITFSCAVLLQLAVWVSVVHATEHPFHAQNEYCSSFINFGHHGVVLDTQVLAVAPPRFSVVTVVNSNASTRFTSHVFYSSRAPPVIV